jgi:asparagine N-glycosylation enzyme membrane subunit Stt3
VAAGWFVEEEENFLANISEIRPLFGADADLGALDAQTYATRLIYVYPLALGWLIFRAARSRRSDLWLVTVWAAVHYGLVLDQVRFLTSFMVSYTIVWGGALAALIEAVRGQTAARRWPVRTVIALLAVGLLTFIAQPSASLMGPELRIAWKGPEGAQPTRRLVRARAFRDAAAWLHENSPTTDGYLDPTQQPQYGVLASWDMGHLIRYVAERPLVQDNFGVYGGREQFMAGWQYFGAADEEEAFPIVERLGVRYVLIDHKGASLGDRGAPDSMADRLYVAHGGRNAENGTAKLTLAPLQHHRLIMETSLARPSFPHVMIYEIVEGARIQGRAAPGAVVHLRLPIRSAVRSAAFTYSARAVTDADGYYRFAVPYSTGGAAPIRTGKNFQLSCGEETAELEVAEITVVSGARIAGPPLRCADAKR